MEFYGLDAVRRRPGMYIGPTDEKGLHQCIFEIVESAVNEHLAGYCRRVDVTLHPDGSCSVRDDGRGMPVNEYPEFKISMAELLLTNLEASDWNEFTLFGGVGVKCINALSTWMRVDICRDGRLYRLSFSRGRAETKLSIVSDGLPNEQSGNVFTFLPDPSIFTLTTQFEFSAIATRLREIAMLNPGLEINLRDERACPSRMERFCYAGGISEFVSELSIGQTVFPPQPISISGRQMVCFKAGGGQRCDVMSFAIAFQLTRSSSGEIFSFVNGRLTSEGGTHVTGFLTALAYSLRRVRRKFSSPPHKGARLTRILSGKGINAVVSIRHPNPGYFGSSKWKLWSPEVKNIVFTQTASYLNDFLDQREDLAGFIQGWFAE